MVYFTENPIKMDGWGVVNLWNCLYIWFPLINMVSMKILMLLMYPKIYGLSHGKSENKMDDDWGYPDFRKPPYRFPKPPGYPQIQDSIILVWKTMVLGTSMSGNHHIFQAKFLVTWGYQSAKMIDMWWIAMAQTCAPNGPKKRIFEDFRLSSL